MTEKMDSSGVESTIVRLCRQHPQGLSQEILTNEMEGVQSDLIVNAINKLLAGRRVTISKDTTGKIVYKEINPDELSKFKGLSSEEMLVFQIIEQSGNMGIWLRGIKDKSGLPSTTITKILKTLDNKRIIKSVNPIANRTKKVYMLYNLEPHSDISGDIWYIPGGQDIDLAFINELSKQCYRFITTQGYASAEEVCAFIRKAGISKVELKLANIQSIIDTLIYDGKLESVDDPRGPAFLGGKSAQLYKPTKISIPPNAFSAMPCGTCPVFDQCSDNGEINPRSCVYFKKWLDF